MHTNPATGPVVTFHADHTGIWTADLSPDDIDISLVCNGIRLDWNSHNVVCGIRVMGDDRCADPLDHLLTTGPAATPDLVAGLFGDLAPAVLCTRGTPGDAVHVNLYRMDRCLETLYRYSQHHALLQEDPSSFEPIRLVWMDQIEGLLVDVLATANSGSAAE